jgi:hypothetical protein
MLAQSDSIERCALFYINYLARITELIKGVDSSIRTFYHQLISLSRQLVFVQLCLVIYGVNYEAEVLVALQHI